MNDIVALKRDFAALAGHLKSGGVAAAGDFAKAAGGQVGDEAAHLMALLASHGERSAKAIGQKVEEQPLLSLLIAFSLGFVASRMLSR